MASVQFYGIDQVMMASRNYKCPAWGIFVNGALFSKCEGGDLSSSLAMLEQMLEMLQETNSTGIYTIKFFECPEGETIKINQKTVCDGGSFNCKLVDEQQRIGRGLAVSGFHEMRAEIEELKKQLAAKEEEEEEPSIGSVVVDLLKDPAQLGQLINIGRSLLGMPVQQYGAPGIGTTRIGTDAIVPEVVSESQEDKLTRLGNAIDTLEQSDPALVDHLEKLAKMAKENPDHFKSILSFL